MAVLLEATRLSTVEERAGGLPLELQLGTGSQGLIYWRSGWQAVVPWAGLKARVTEEGPTTLRITCHGRDTKVFTLAASAAETRWAIERFSPDAFNPDAAPAHSELSDSEIREGLRARIGDVLDGALEAAVDAGPGGELALVAALGEARMSSRVLIVSCA